MLKALVIGWALIPLTVMAAIAIARLAMGNVKRR